MKHQITLKNLEQPQQLKKLLPRFQSKLEKQLPSFAAEQAFLHETLEKHPTRSLYHVSLVLNLIGTTLVTHEVRSNLKLAIREAFLELERQLKKYKALVRGVDQWKRLARREQLRRKTKIEPAPVDDQERQKLFNLIQPHLEKLNQFVRREISYHLATGDLKSDELTREDVVDTVVLNAYEEYKKGQPDLPLDRLLIMLAMKYIRSEVARLRKEREEFVHLEEDIPETPPEEYVVTLGDETLDFYQPDEDLRMEDVVPDPSVPTPDQLAEGRESRSYVNRTLRHLPRTWRDAFVLNRIEGFSVEEVAKITKQPEKDVKRYLQQATEFVRQKLIDSGFNSPK